MKVLVIVMDCLTGLLLLSTLICGLWIKGQPQVDPSSIRFHAQIAVASTILAMAAITLSTISAFRRVA